MALSVISRNQLEELVLEDVLNDPTLSSHDEQMRRKCIRFVLASTDPKTGGRTCDLQKLSNFLLELKFGTNPTAAQTKELNRIILSALLDEALGLKNDSDFFGEITMKKNKPRADPKKLLIRLDRLNAILMSSYFVNEPAIKAYVQCYDRVFQSYRKHNEAAGNVHSEWKEALTDSAQKRKILAMTTEENGINTKLGILAYFDKQMLNKLVPGPGTQQEKVAKARNLTSFRGSCSAQLTAPPQSYRAYAYQYTNFKLFNDPDFLNSNDPKVKRQRLNALGKEFLETNPPPRLSDDIELNIKYSYDPSVFVRPALEAKRLTNIESDHEA